MEKSDLLFDAVFPDAKVVFEQVGDVAAVAVHDADGNRDERGVHLDDVTGIDLFGSGWCLILLLLRLLIVGIVAPPSTGGFVGAVVAGAVVSGAVLCGVFAWSPTRRGRPCPKVRPTELESSARSDMAIQSFLIASSWCSAVSWDRK